MFFSKEKKLIPSNESKEITSQPSKSKESSSSSVNQIIEINTPEIEGNAEINKDENGQLDILVNNAYKGVNVFKHF